MAGFCRCCRRRNHATKVLDEHITSVAPTEERSRSKESHHSQKSQSDRSSKHSREGSLKGAPAEGRPFPKRPLVCKLSQNCWDKLEALFRKMDPDGSNAVSKDEARVFFKGAFGKMSADAMFNEVDVDGSGAIDADEFIQFWIHVRKNGYKEQDILDELHELLEGGAWVDWNDGRDTTQSCHTNFPKRSMLCRLKQPTWDKCQQLFEMIDTDKKLIITKEKAVKHFKGGFSKVSVDAMFNEIDVQHHGQITAKEWMKFWSQVKSNGYSQQDILDELVNLLKGEQWVDWKDGRSTA